MAGKNDYKTISLGFFFLGIIFFCHSMITNLSISGKKNRTAILYIVISIIIFYCLFLEEYVDLISDELTGDQISGASLTIILIVLSIMRYGNNIYNYL